MDAVARDQEPSLFSQDADPVWLDELITLSKAVKAIPGGRGAKSVNPSTAYRWVVDGRLQAVRCGGRLLTTRRWLKAMLVRDTENYAIAKGIGKLSVSTVSAGSGPAQLSTKPLGVEIEHSSESISGSKK